MASSVSPSIDNANFRWCPIMSSHLLGRLHQGWKPKLPTWPRSSEAGHKMIIILLVHQGPAKFWFIYGCFCSSLTIAPLLKGTVGTFSLHQHIQSIGCGDDQCGSNSGGVPLPEYNSAAGRISPSIVWMWKYIHFYWSAGWIILKSKHKNDPSMACF